MFQVTGWVLQNLKMQSMNTNGSSNRPWSVFLMPSRDKESMPISSSTIPSPAKKHSKEKSMKRCENKSVLLPVLTSSRSYQVFPKPEAEKSCVVFSEKSRKGIFRHWETHLPFSILRSWKES